MNKMNSLRKIKKALNPKRQIHKNVGYLELTIRSNRGKYTKLPLPVRTISVQRKIPYKTVNFVKVAPLSTHHIRIEGVASRYVAQEMLVNKKIHYVVGNKKLEGRIMSVVPATKGPEGIPAPAPPPLS